MKGFDRDNPKWLCCCIHITTGIYIIAVLEISGLIYSVVRTSLAIAAPGSAETESHQIYWSSRSLLPIELAMSVTGLIVVILMTIGVRYWIPSLLIAHIVGQCVSAVIVIVLIMVQTFYFGYREKLSTKVENSEGAEGISIAVKLPIVIGITVAIAIVEVYVIYLLLRGIAFIKAAKEADRVSNNMWKSVETARRQSSAPNILALPGANHKRDRRSSPQVLTVLPLTDQRRGSANPPRRNSNRP